MINWMEQEIKEDPYVFIRKSLLESTRRYGISQPAVIIISDARRLNDIEYLIKTFGDPNAC
uniref:SJCHGC02791 protein n=1 Tax=Schistosoma japonicum TaxID=6182 RepID=Q3KTK2_SCHJA|nr:SJCHGC02791 protein [Schistosoma japonicum]